MTQLRDNDDVGWNEGQWLFPRAVRILEVETYRLPILRGLVLSVGSKTDSTVSLLVMDALRTLVLTVPTATSRRHVSHSIPKFPASCHR